MKKIFMAALVVGLTAITGSLAAENWECKYSGSWTRTSDGKSGDLSWTVTWVKQGGGWTVIGNMNDQYGVSAVNGSCANKNCTFTQAYSSGSLVGKPYVYVGSYTDKVLGDGQTINNFTGTWTGNGNSGAWKAKAMCSRK